MLRGYRKGYRSVLQARVLGCRQLEQGQPLLLLSLRYYRSI